MAKKPHRPRDVNQLAKMVVDIATGSSQDEIEPVVKVSTSMSAIGKLGGLRGGRMRAERLSPERRTEIAKAAAAARWPSSKDDSD